MDPQVRQFLAVVNASKQPPIDQVPIAEARAQFNSLTPIFHPPVEVAAVRDFKTPSGVPLRIYHPSPQTEPAPPGIVYFHGGGWVLGNLDTHDTLCRHLSIAAQAAVIAVDYRLAPEHVFPAALDDAFEAVCHVADHATELGIDPRKLAVAGDSAGGNLAAAVCLKACEGGPAIALQILLYPVLDPRCDTASYAAFADGFGLTRSKMKFFWNAYAPGDLRLHPGASPALEPGLKSLPPAMILTAEFDVLRDEGADFARRLAAAGVETEYRQCDGVIHGFLHYAGAIERGRAELQTIGRRIAERLRA